jgi:uncharacterized protein
MPVAPTYPGVYVEEIPSGVRTIVGVATSITAFVGRAARGPTEEATTINNFGDFERMFGGLWADSSLGFAVRDFYLNGGSQAVIVRLFNPTFVDETARQAAHTAATAQAQTAADAVAKAATDAVAVATPTPTPQSVAKAAQDAVAAASTPGQAAKAAAEAVAKAAADAAAVTPAPTAQAVADAANNAKAKAVTNAANAAAPFSKSKLVVGNIKLEGAYEGKWGANLRSRVDLDNITDPNLLNLTVQDAGPGGSSERFLNLSTQTGSSRQIDKVLKAESRLVRWDGNWPPATLPNLAAIRTAFGELADAQKATPPVPATIAAKQDALWSLTQDSITQAESKYLRAKKALEKKQNDGGDATAEKKALEQAKVALEDTRRSATDAVSDGSVLSINTFLPLNGQTNKKGMYALEQLFAQASLFNILCIPPYKASTDTLDVDVNLISAAASYCEERRAMLLVDPPKDWTDKRRAKEKFTDAAQENVGTRSKNAAIYFPRLIQPNSLKNNQMEEFVPCGAVAGVMARTDTQRGVWKAPAGLDATLVGVSQLSVNLTDAENGELNPLGINCLRAFPIAGRVVWGARTLRGADQLADEYKYVPIRRLALFIEESLYRGTQWVVFEPNDEPLWAQIRLNVGAFMHNLFRQGAFQGRTPREAYLVKCDKETTNQNDINLGIVNIVVGFAPLKPAEFVIIKIQQLAGQIEV